MGQMDFFDKLVTFEFGWINTRQGGIPDRAKDGNINFIGQCSSDTFFQFAIETPLFNIEPSLIVAFNSTSNFIVVQNFKKADGTDVKQLWVIHVHFDPDTSKCADLSHITPPTASFIRP